MTQSKAELTGDKQILYLVQWFAEFSDFQRNDFLHDYLQPIYGKFLNEKVLNNNNERSHNNDNSQLNSNNVGPANTDDIVENGLVNSGDNNNKDDDSAITATVNGIDSLGIGTSSPPSIFQCRMKLFKEWYHQWSDNERIEFLLRLRNIDSAFLVQFYRLFFTKNEIANYDKFAELIKQQPDETKLEEIVNRLELNENLFAQFELAPPATAANVVIDSSGSFNSLNSSLASLNYSSLNRQSLVGGGGGSLATAAAATTTIGDSSAPIDDQSANIDSVTVDCTPPIATTTDSTSANANCDTLAEASNDIVVVDTPAGLNGQQTNGHKEQPEDEPKNAANSIDNNGPAEEAEEEREEENQKTTSNGKACLLNSDKNETNSIAEETSCAPSEELVA